MLYQQFSVHLAATVRYTDTLRTRRTSSNGSQLVQLLVCVFETALYLTFQLISTKFEGNNYYLLY